MRLLTPWFVGRWEGRMINIHPSLLPAFKGLDTHARALAAGCRIHGATVHFVVPEMDSGPIIAQGAVTVLPEDTEATLAARGAAATRQLAKRQLTWLRAMQSVPGGTLERFDCLRPDLAAAVEARVARFA